MKKVILIVVIALAGSLGAHAQQANANANESEGAKYLCHRNDAGEVVALVEYLYTPGGKVIAKPLVIKGGGVIPPVLEKPNGGGGLTVNCNYVAKDHACYGPNAVDCVCIGKIVKAGSL